MVTDTGSCVWKGISRAILPDEINLTVWEWADKHRMLDSTGSAEPGRYKTDRTPYLKAIMEALSPGDPVQEVVFMKGSQIGATEAGSNWLGYIIDVSPAPVLVVQPTGDLIKRYVKQRFDPMVNNTRKLRAKISDTKTRDKSNSMFSKSFPGGFMILTGANSSSGLRSAPVRYIFMDEVDDYPKDVSSQGDVVKLAEARTRTFRRNRKIFMPSTPTIKGHSRIEKAFELSSQDYFYLPCPHCNEKQILKFGNLRWEKGRYETVYYACLHCGEAIDEKHKGWMLAHGEWRSHKPNIKHRRGFHLSALYSPPGWFGWGDVAKEFEEAQKDVDQLKTFVNTILGESWEDKGEVPDWEELYERSEDYTLGVVPEGGLFLTAGIDVQKDRIEMEVVAWGRDKESWSVDYVVIKGDTGSDEMPWNELRKSINKRYKTHCGASLDIRQIAIDSGNQTQLIYNWVRNTNDSRLIAIKGMDQKSAGHVVMVGKPKDADITHGGKRIYRGVKFWPVHVSIAKDELFSFLRRKKKKDDEFYPPGYCHFPDVYDKEHFRQLCSEQKISKVIGGRSILQWQKIYERNETLDCRVYARAAAFVLGIDRFEDEHWEELENYLRNYSETDSLGYNENSDDIKIVKSNWL